MQDSIRDGQILEFHGVSGDKLVLSSSPLSNTDFLVARYTSENGPYPQDGKPWSTMKCLCLGERKGDTKYKKPPVMQKSPDEIQGADTEHCEMVFQEDGMILVEYPYRGNLYGAVIERIDGDGGRHAPDGIRSHWTESPDRFSERLSAAGSKTRK